MELVIKTISLFQNQHGFESELLSEIVLTFLNPLSLRHSSINSIKAFFNFISNPPGFTNSMLLSCVVNCIKSDYERVYNDFNYHGQLTSQSPFVEDFDRITAPMLENIIHRGPQSILEPRIKGKLLRWAPIETILWFKNVAGLEFDCFSLIESVLAILRDFCDSPDDIIRILPDIDHKVLDLNTISSGSPLIEILFTKIAETESQKLFEEYLCSESLIIVLKNLVEGLRSEITLNIFFIAIQLGKSIDKDSWEYLCEIGKSKMHQDVAIAAKIGKFQHGYRVPLEVLKTHFPDYFATTRDQNSKCDYCGVTGMMLKTCARCKKVCYCGLECQKVHWSNHKVNCKPRH